MDQRIHLLNYGLSKKVLDATPKLESLSDLLRRAKWDGGRQRHPDLIVSFNGQLPLLHHSTRGAELRRLFDTEDHYCCPQVHGHYLFMGNYTSGWTRL